MHRVKNFYNELAQGKLVLAFQPVVWMPDSDRVLYQEGLLRHIDASGEGVYPLVMLEQFAGVMYIGLVVSRLVGLTMLRRM